ncbi:MULTISPECIES: type II secretion system F family protein [Paenibacillus]|uniref:Type II secretion system protein GspF domain-containing protein n=2 Tax=Paenibacillus TaxID=44249 RepID=A0A7Y6EUF0_9BACL|nr:MULTISPECIES: type II secretion system F family protein [Paenibacillus]KGP77790.1 hypothetical protein P364_0131495 [Paenibacillus sp. MAEPY2]KGP79563.1 hypothetical protein P363_0131020 [Paenibacillus sp. MAEPY1]MDN4603982.1 type II secretion system F family protein [Paenibacillus vandeheii]NUU74678.1 hypothetical protein [Paenibacillus xylanilyticus]
MEISKILYISLFAVMFIALFFLLQYLLPKKKYRSWTMVMSETEEEQIHKKTEEAERKKRFTFAKYLSPNHFENEARITNWDVGTKAPLYLYGGLLLGIGFGFLMNSPIAIICGAYAGIWAPWFILNNKKQKYEDFIEEQIEVLIQEVSAGYSITQNLTDSMKKAESSLEEPIRSMWSKLVTDYYAGDKLSNLLTEMQKSIPVKEFKMFSDLLVIVERSGGDASPTMKQIADVIQSNRILKEEAKAELTQQRQSHRMNVTIAIGIVLFFRFAQADQYKQLMVLPLGQLLITLMILYILWSFQKVNKMTQL